MEELEFYVYEVNLTDEKGKRLDEVVKFSTSSLRWKTLEKEIKTLKLLMDHSTLKQVHVTKDRNEARSMATEY